MTNYNNSNISRRLTSFNNNNKTNDIKPAHTANLPAIITLTALITYNII